MLDHLDNLVRQLFVSEIDEITSESQVRFSAADEDWRTFVSNLTVGGQPANALNVYLVELRENRRLRSNERTRTFDNALVNETADRNAAIQGRFPTGQILDTPSKRIAPTAFKASLRSSGQYCYRSLPTLAVVALSPLRDLLSPKLIDVGPGLR